MKKPDWWPDCPYPKSIFPMERDQYAEIVPDPKIRTALSGCLGREFWEIASGAIWDAMQDAIEFDDWEPEKQEEKNAMPKT